MSKVAYFTKEGTNTPFDLGDKSTVYDYSSWHLYSVCVFN